MNNFSYLSLFLAVCNSFILAWNIWIMRKLLKSRYPIEGTSDWVLFWAISFNGWWCAFNVSFNICRV